MKVVRSRVAVALPHHLLLAFVVANLQGCFFPQAPEARQKLAQQGNRWERNA
jgi:hypothetical protein